jgi:hypothetical protein
MERAVSQVVDEELFALVVSVGAFVLGCAVVVAYVGWRE